ncbi:CPP1-like family protein [Cyanobium sp. NIES-981]|uniref:CPP1-like family protein n=1 Tax=Cyanobium sp. NIES-981 TaxID=1851505 RepID=UPI001CED41E8|nr:CPP1-like family protein [Cyanobium sp. NIES-981]
MPDPSDPQPPAAEPLGPYERLGVTPESSFEEVQAAKQSRLDEAGDDPMARSRIEAAYDALLMERLKQRQQGRVSTAARTASAREQLAPPPPPRVAMPALPQLSLPKVARPSLGWPALELAQGNDLGLALGGFGLLLGLLLVAPSVAPEFLLALATGFTVVCLQRRRRRFLAAVGWGFGLLTLGLVLGGLLMGATASGFPLGLPLNPLQLQSIPAMLLLLLAALFVA